MTEINKGGRPVIEPDSETEKLGRKKIEFDDKDWRMIEQMCALYCTGNEIAGVMGVHYDTLAARIKETYGSNFSDYFDRHSAKGGLSLRRKQRDVAMDGNVQMLIHLGKNYLGQTDKQHIDNTSSDGSMSPPQPLTPENAKVIDNELEDEY